jgi:hypothetical protein
MEIWRIEVQGQPGKKVCEIFFLPLSQQIKARWLTPIIPGMREV